ncbi:MAG: hypothetical protein IKT20_02165 [Clostridiales bacterium]|nr:hypothetical protein [Clostridiales bacterium]
MGFIDFVSLLFASGVGFGLSCWIFGSVLDKSNNLGDYKGESFDYSASARFDIRRDKMSKDESSSFTHMFGKRIDTSPAPKGDELVRRLTPEELSKYKKSDVPSGAFVSEKNGITGNKSFVDEFEKWEKENKQFGDLKGVFKPLEEENDDRAGF